MCEFDKNVATFTGEKEILLWNEDSSAPCGPKQHPFLLEEHPHFPE